jgi:predicted transcriptional regulator
MTIKHDSVTHDILVYAKMMNKPFKPTDPMVIFAKMDRVSKIERSIKTLIEHGYLKDCNDGQYMITLSGIDHIYVMARRLGISQAHGNN